MENKIIQGDCLEELKKLPDESVDCVVTSPPYWALRDYGVEGQLGLEPTFQEYITKLCDIFDGVKRVLKKDGTCWVNIGDTYSAAHTGGHKSKKSTVGANNKNAQEIKQVKNTDLQDKCLCQIPSRFAIEMTNRGWILRNQIIWYKPNCMPSSVKDRFTVDYEPVFFFTKNKKYWFETQYEAHISEKERGGGKKIASMGSRWGGQGLKDWKKENSLSGRNKRCVWKIPTKPLTEAHFATFPEKLIEPMIRAGCPEKGIVLDPFFGAGTTGLVAKKLKRQWLGIELNPEYIEIAKARINSIPEPML